MAENKDDFGIDDFINNLDSLDELGKPETISHLEAVSMLIAMHTDVLTGLNYLMTLLSNPEGVDKKAVTAWTLHSMQNLSVMWKERYESYKDTFESLGGKLEEDNE